MQGDGDELLVTIAPAACAIAAAEGEYRPWLGIMVMIGLPVLLAIAAFLVIIAL